MANVPKNLKYRDLKAQLQAELDWFDSSNLDIDEALAHYQRAGELIKQMQHYLESTKNEFEESSQVKKTKS